MGIGLRRRAPAAGVVLMGLAGAGALVLLGLQVRRFTSGGAGRAVDRDAAAAAYFLGFEVLGDLQRGEGTIALLLPPETRGNSRLLDSWFDTFARVVTPLEGVAVKEVTVRCSGRLAAEGRVPVEAVEGALAEVPGALAWVSFVGVPVGGSGAAAWPGAGAPPVYVYDPGGGTGWVAALKQGRIRRVVVPRPRLEGRAEGPAAGPPDQLFRENFLMATPSNADTVAAELE